MKSLKQHLWKYQILLIIWITQTGCGSTPRTTTEMPPPHHSSRMVASSDALQKKDDDIGKYLLDIAQYASREPTNQRVDLTFVINPRLVGHRPEKWQRWIDDMNTVFKESKIDYRVAFIWFQGDASQIRGKPLQKGLIMLETGVGKSPIKFLRFRGVVARYGLDAVMTGLAELKFRWTAERSELDNELDSEPDSKPDSDKHFVVMTHEPLKTDWGTGRENELVQKILDHCRQEDIRISVIGIDEEIQLQLAYLSGGRWYKIGENQRADEHEHADLFMPFLPNIDLIFDRIAQHILETVQQPTDIVFVFDSSLSMDDKVDEICTGVDTLIQVLDNERLDYRLGVIRFWASSGGGQSSIVTTKPPLNAEQVKKLFRRPRRGSEHLLDAIIKGVPKLQTPANRKLVLIIVTDEPASRGPGTGYTYTQATNVCQHAHAQVNIIGGIRPLRQGSGAFVDADKFQLHITQATNGIAYIMPGIVPQWRDRHSR